jgi:hypothetical protein
VSEQDRPPPTKHAFDRGVVAGRDAERAAVVAYLVRCGLIGAAENVRAGDHLIERGEHRKEEP